MVSDRLRAPPTRAAPLRPEARLGSEHPACGSPGPSQQVPRWPLPPGLLGATPSACHSRSPEAPPLPPGLVGTSGADLGVGWRSQAELCRCAPLRTRASRATGPAA